jgi:Domain of unknown function (DUF2017)
VKAWKRHGRGERVRYVAVLDRPEASVLRGLMGQVDDMLAGRGAEAPADELAALTGIRTGPSTRPDDPVLARLLPDFAPESEPDADELSAALRSVREPELIEAKQAAIATVLATCPAGGGRVELAPQQAEQWLTAINDVRLALGVALEVTEDMPEGLPPDDPRADHLPVYHWLTWLQDSLVGVLAA